MKMRNGSVAQVSLIALAGAACLSTVQAQAASVLEEITVTSRKRTENLQTVPQSVTVLGARLIEDAAIDTMQEVIEMVPNLSMFTNFRAGVVQLVVRGVTTPQNGEAPMSFVVDGVTVPEIDFINQDVFDVASVQILRGPQGALYGRGALGGAVVISTRQPTDDFEGNAKASYESGEDVRLSGVLSGPIIAEKLRFRVAGTYHDREGQLYNVTRDDHDDFADEKAIRGQVYWAPAETVSIDATAKYLESEIGGGIFSVVPNARLDDFSLPLDQNVRGVNDRDIFEASVKIDWDLGFGTLTSVSAYSHIDDELVSDGDFRATVATAQRNRSKIKAYTEEIRLTSPDDQALRWIVGAFYQDRAKKFEFDFADDVGRTSGAFAERFDVNFEQRDNTDSTAIGLFVSADYDITEAVELSTALRYDRDRREFIDPRVPASAAKRAFEQLQPRVSLSYSFNDDLLAYISYARGFRSGGFNEVGFGSGPGIPAPTTYEKETSNSYEAGFKATFLNGLATANAAFFHIDMSGNQFTVFDVATFALGIKGIDKATVDGMDLEITARPFEGLSVNLGVGISDTNIKDFDGTDLFIGNAIPEVPAHTVNAGVQYTHPLTDELNLVGRGDFRQQGKTHWDEDNNYVTGPKRYLDLRMTLEAAQWSVMGYVENLFDVQQTTIGSARGLTEVAHSPSKPRTFGVRGAFSF